MNAVLREALAHLDRGFAATGTRDKEPASDLIRRTRGRGGWRQLVRKPATATEVCDWFELDPTTGIGVLTGEVSNVVVVDIDTRRRRRACPRPPPSRHCAASTAYLRPNGPVRTREFPWGEIRGEGAYVVAPCSRRADGGAYTWELTPEDAGIADFAAFENSAASPYIRTTCFRRSTCSPRVSRASGHSPTSSVTSIVALRLARALGAP